MQKQFTLSFQNTEQVSIDDWEVKKYGLQFDETATLKEVKEAVRKKLGHGATFKWKIYGSLSENEIE